MDYPIWIWKVEKMMIRDMVYTDVEVEEMQAKKIKELDRTFMILIQNLVTAIKDDENPYTAFNSYVRGQVIGMCYAYADLSIISTVDVYYMSEAIREGIL